MQRLSLGIAALALWLQPSMAQAQVGTAESLATQLANPISSLISVPFQYNFDCCFGPSEANRDLLNIQPVVPFKLNPDWNLIVRTILPSTRHTGSLGAWGQRSSGRPGPIL